MDITNKLMKLIEIRGITPSKLFKDTGISPDTMANYRRGISSPSREDLEILMKYLGLKTSIILRNFENEKSQPPTLNQQTIMTKPINEKHPKMSLGQKLMYIIDHREHVKDNGTKIPLTAYQVSKDTGISAYALGLYKKGVHDPQNRILQKLLKYLDVSIDYVEAIGELTTPLSGAENGEPQPELIYQLNARITTLEKYVQRLDRDLERAENEIIELKKLLTLVNKNQSSAAN